MDTKTTINHWTEDLERLHACTDSIAWARDYESLRAAWTACECGDWMLWLAGKQAGAPMSDSRRPLVLAACECARLALPHVMAGETRPLAAIELAERWARGDDSVTREQLRAAASAAAAAAYAAAAAAAYAAAYAADAAYAAYAAAAAAYAAARILARKQCADIVRKHYPQSPVIVKRAAVTL